jgi:hypothetical protein
MGQGINMKLEFHPAKIGTIPSTGVYIKTNPIVGKKIKFREYGSKIWEEGYVTKIIEETGYLFISR